MKTKKKFQFSLESLLTGVENPKGPITQALFAQKMADHLDLHTCNLLARVTFAYPTTNKAFPGGAPLHETLLLGCENWDGSTVLHLCIRGGQAACKIATAYFPKGRIDLHEEYRDVLLLRGLSDGEIKEIFNYVNNNMDTVRPRPGYLED